ncbi:MAG TPA: hypothetical protein VGS79_04660 [Puia sp.]|nr:hypothetical protein [Puia sp.]
MSQTDPRYETIQPMVQEGRIQTFLDIFKYVPRTVVARDLGKKVTRLSVSLRHLENFTIGELFLIANLCKLSRTEILELITMEVSLRDRT